MKNKKTRLIALLVSAVLLIGVGVGVLIASGAETGASAKIGMRNVIYDEKMCFAVQILDQNVDEKNETLGLIFWNEDKDLPTAELKVSNATSVSYERCYDAKANVYYYCTAGIAPDSVFDEVRFAACVKNNTTGAISIISEISSYSIAQYLGTRVIADNATYEQTVLYEKVFNYGNAAMSVLQDGDYAESLALIHTVGGTVGAHNVATYGGYLGATVRINAPAYNAAGDAFHGWEFGGVIVSRETSFDVKLGATGIHTYTAIYGDTDIPDAGEGDPIYPTTPVLYNAEVMSAKGGADGIVVLIHDDGKVSSVQTIDSIYQQYGLVGDMALYKTTAEKNTSTWQSYLNTGRWKVVSHSETHTYWGEYNESSGNSKCDTPEEVASHFNEDGTCKGDNVKKLYDETVGIQQLLRELFPGQRVLTFAYPGFSDDAAAFKAYLGSSYNIFDHVRSATSRALIEQTYISARAGLGFGVNVKDPESTWNTKYAGNRYLEDTVWNYFPAYSWGSNKDTALNAVNKAANNGELAVIYCHEVMDGATPKADYIEVAELLSGYVNDGKVWNTHYEDAVLYVREATSSTLTVKSADETGMVVSLTDMMDDSIYDMALTVRVNVPAEWEAVNVTQNGKTSYAYCEFIDGVWAVDTDIVPDRGDATITPITAEQIEAETTYDLKAEASFDFKTGLQGAYIYNSSQTSTTLAATSMGSRTALSLKKTVAASDGGRLLFPLGKTVSDAETIEIGRAHV